jgi:DNA-binding MarR family transcriptional regulator
MYRLELLDQLIEGLHIIGKHTAARLENRDNVLCPISPPQMRLLFFINHKERTTTTEIAQVMGITAGAVTQLLDPLVEQSIITKTKDVHDKRTSHIEIGDEGKKRFQQIKQEHLKSMLPMFEVFSDEDLQTMVRLQKKLVDYLLLRS